MRKASPWAAMLTVLSALGAEAAAADPRGLKEAPSADLILTHAVIYTLDAAQRIAQSVAVSQGKIIYVGSDAGARALRTPKTRVIDVRGRTVLPGLADAHVHPALGEFLNHRLCNVRAFTLDDGFAKVRRCAAAAPPGDWVVGYGWYDLDAAAFDRVTRAQMDALVADRKLAIISKDLHTAWVNSKTLQAYGIGKDTASPAGGEIVRDPASGEPTGELIDAAAAPIWRAVQLSSTYAAPTEELLQSAMAHLNSLGITSIVEALADDETMAAYHHLDARGKLTMRVSAAFGVLPDNYRTEVPRIAASRAQWQSPRVRVDFIKVLADGNQEVGLSSLLNHDGPPETATPGYYTASQMKELVELAEAGGLGVFVHAIGDGAAREVLDAVAAARKASPLTPLRHTLTHLCWVADSDLPRLKELGVIANIQEGWLAPAAFGGPPGYDYARSTAAGPIGPWLAGRLFPFRPLHDAGALLAAGSDWFYTEENPWVAMEAGMTSKDPGGPNAQAMLPNDTLDFATLIRARTANAAYQMYRERETGAIEPGKRGDLIVIDQDPFHLPAEKLHQTQVLMTFIDGQAVFDRSAQR